MRLVRKQAGNNITPNKNLRDVPENARVTVLGAVITRQRPATASGVVFITLEDENGSANIIVWKNAFSNYRAQVMQGRLLKISGKVQRQSRDIHVISEYIEDLSYLFDQLGEADASINMTWSSADDVKEQIPGNRQTSRYKKTASLSRHASAPAGQTVIPKQGFSLKASQKRRPPSGVSGSNVKPRIYASRTRSVLFKNPTSGTPVRRIFDQGWRPADRRGIGRADSFRRRPP